MTSRVFVPTQRLLSQSSSLRLHLPASFAVNTRPISTIRSVPVASYKHSSVYRCVSCASSLSSSRLPAASSRLSSSSSSLLTRSFASGGDAHAEHSHGDFLPAHDIEARILTVLRGIDKLSGASITAQSTFAELGLDSLDEVEVVMQIEEEFMVDLFEPTAVNITSVQEAVKIISETPFAM